MGKTQNKTAWAIFVVGIVLYDLTNNYSLTDFLNGDTPPNALVDSVLSKFKLVI